MFPLAGALALSSVLLFPGTLGGGAVFSGWVPFSPSIIGSISAEAKKVIHFLLLFFVLNLD